jgi:ribokinase
MGERIIGNPPGMTVIVVGQAGMDVVLRTDGVPEAGGSTRLMEYRQQPGGKGTNQAVGLAQLGVPVALVAVLGTDPPGDASIAQLHQDRVDHRAVVRRGSTAVLLDLVDAPGSRRLFERVPPSALLTETDIAAACSALDTPAVDTVSLQLQQPAEAVLAAARWGRDAGALVVADGAPQPDARRELFALVRVLRVDSTEAGMLAGQPVESVPAATALGRQLLGEGPELVAIAVPGIGDLLVRPDGSRLLEFADAPVQDRTGAGDAFVAGLITGLRRGEGPVGAGRLAAAAASSTVRHLGGRPDLRDLAG